VGATTPCALASGTKPVAITVANAIAAARKVKFERMLKYRKRVNFGNSCKQNTQTPVSFASGPRRDCSFWVESGRVPRPRRSEWRRSRRWLSSRNSSVDCPVLPLRSVYHSDCPDTAIEREHAQCRNENPISKPQGQPSVAKAIQSGRSNTNE